MHNLLQATSHTHTPHKPHTVGHLMGHLMGCQPNREPTKRASLSRQQRFGVQNGPHQTTMTCLFLSIIPRWVNNLVSTSTAIPYGYGIA